jgi:RNA polymerase sigma-70 factor, ECF subfamily
MDTRSQATEADGLVDRLKRGEASAYREMMRLYERRLFAFCLGFLRQEDEAMDAVQDSFIKVFKKVHTFRGDAQFSTWLFRIARNLCLDRCRRKARVPMDELDDARAYDSPRNPGPALLSTSTTGSNPDTETMRAELRSEIASALDVLSDAHKEILLLREVEGLAYNEIAEVLDVPIGTVMSRLFHARKNMQRRLSRYLDPGPSEGRADRAARSQP